VNIKNGREKGEFEAKCEGSFENEDTYSRQNRRTFIAIIIQEKVV